MTSLVKICGLGEAGALEAALLAGADMVGFVRFPRSPRHVDLPVGRDLSAQAKGRAMRVVLLVDPDDAALDEAVGALDPDLVQLHGRETPERVAAIRARTGRQVMKAVGIASAADLAEVAAQADAADRILLDAKAPPGARLPGGNGVPFDWSLLDGLPARLRLDAPGRLMLSGGLTAESVAEAVATTGLRALDVSSGVERSPGLKDPDLIRRFVAAARAACAAHQPRRVA